MKYGFVKVAAASPDLKVADVEYNTAQIIRTIEEQAKAGVEILVFPELSLCGYTCGDLLLNKTLIDACLTALERVADATKNKKMLVFVGLPFEAQAGKLYNCAAAVSEGEVKGLIPKTHVPNYGEFYEQRYFMGAWDGEGAWFSLPWGERSYIGADVFFEDEEHGVTVACEICEDLWAPISPSAQAAITKANIIVNLSASDETVGKREYRHTLVAAQSGKCLCGYVYCDAGTGESTGDMVFAGNHIVYENGVLLAEAEPFSDKVCTAEIDTGFLNAERRKNNTFHDEAGKEHFCVSCSFVGDGMPTRVFPQTPFVPQEGLSDRAETVLAVQARALAKRLRHTKAKTAVIGVSGGLDSALAFLVTVRAFDLLNKDRKDIIAITMPGFGTTGRTKNNSLKLMQAMGATSRTVDISDTVLAHFRDIGHDRENYNAAYENAQARYRTMVLMDIANDTGGLVIGTGDLSELALGWCTYNGDHMSNYAVNCSVPKTLVKYLVGYEGKRLGGEAEKVLTDVLGTEISPELLPPDKQGNIAQKTEDIVGPYELHDYYLYHFLRRGESPAKTFALAQNTFAGKYDRATLKKWLLNFYRRLFSQQFKRSCAPDGIKVGSVSLSPRGDWRMPSDAEEALWLKEAETL